MLSCQVNPIHKVWKKGYTDNRWLLSLSYSVVYLSYLKNLQLCDCNRQVVRYGVDGHYHAHLDSETHEHPDFPCCHQVPNAGTDNENKCKLCRYVFHHTSALHCIENVK